MTQAKSIPHPMDDDDDMLPEYDFSKMGTPVRGKHAQRIRAKGYSTIVHHADGTSTTTHVTPEAIALRRGDYVAGDKIGIELPKLPSQAPQTPPTPQAKK